MSVGKSDGSRGNDNQNDIALGKECALITNKCMHKAFMQLSIQCYCSYYVLFLSFPLPSLPMRKFLHTSST